MASSRQRPRARPAASSLSSEAFSSPGAAALRRGGGGRGLGGGSGGSGGRELAAALPSGGVGGPQAGVEQLSVVLVVQEVVGVEEEEGSALRLLAVLPALLPVHLHVFVEAKPLQIQR